MLSTSALLKTMSFFIISKAIHGLLFRKRKKANLIVNENRQFGGYEAPACRKCRKQSFVRSATSRQSSLFKFQKAFSFAEGKDAFFYLIYQIKDLISKSNYSLLILLSNLKSCHLLVRSTNFSNSTRRSSFELNK